MTSTPSDPGTPTAAVAGRRPRPLLDRFVRSRRGATALEFALVALPFLFMIFSILELALVMLVNITLENAVNVAARQIRTNQQQAAGIYTSGTSNYDFTSVDNFRDLICNNMSWLSQQCLAGVSSSVSTSGGVTTANTSAGGSLVVDLRDPSSFSGVNVTSPVNSNGQLLQFDGTKCFYAGSAGSIVVLRAFYPWNLFTPFLSGAFYHDTNGKSVVLQAAAVFKNEPYGGSTSSANGC